MRFERAEPRVVLAGVLALAAGSLALACGAAEPAVSSAAAAQEPVMAVETARVARGEIRAHLVVAGSLVARRASQIGARVPGRIARLRVHVGDRVAKGDILFEIESYTYAAALKQARAGLDVARAERRQFEEDLERQETLLDKDLVPQQRVAQLRTRVEVAQARERQAAQAVEIAGRDLADTAVRAPYAGSIARRLADEGTAVMPQNTVLEIQETAWLEARAAVAESRLGLVHVGDGVRIYVPGRPEAIQAQVDAVADTIDPATRTYLVRIAVPNADHRLKAGLFAKIEIDPRSLADVLRVPRTALRTVDGRSEVFRIHEGRAESVVVQTGIVTEEAAEIVDGLIEGETVIVGDAVQLVVPGMKLEETRAAGDAVDAT
jgi:RND family efflux transporter MFP subunit